MKRYVIRIGATLYESFQQMSHNKTEFWVAAKAASIV